MDQLRILTSLEGVREKEVRVKATDGTFDARVTQVVKKQETDAFLKQRNSSITDTDRQQLESKESLTQKEITFPSGVFFSFTYSRFVCLDSSAIISFSLFPVSFLHKRFSFLT